MKITSISIAIAIRRLPKVEYKGALTEQFVLQQLKTLSSTSVYYYSAENSQLELDFIIQCDGHIIPLEVKAEENLRAKSLRQFYTQNPDYKAIRISMSNYRQQDWMTNIPLYVCCEKRFYVE